MKEAADLVEQQANGQLRGVLGHALIEAGDADVRACIAVTDTDRGITPADQGYIFDPFWQADPSWTASGGSSGLPARYAGGSDAGAGH